jgi:replicative DNA helicase
MGNGKSTLLMSQMEWLAQEQRPTLYLPLEVDTEVCRVRWAAWKLGFDPKDAIRQDWGRLPEGARESIGCVLDEQRTNPFIHFVPSKRVTFDQLARWCAWGKEQVGASVVMVDHLHRMEFGPDGSSYRVAVTDAVRRLKDLARELSMVIICAAQLNRSADPLDAYMPPQVGRLKESAGIAEEADVVVMLSRRLRSGVSREDMRLVETGHRSERDLSEPNVMSVTCRKHRLDDSARDRTILLSVNQGRLENRIQAWQSPPADWRDK